MNNIEHRQKLNIIGFIIIVGFTLSVFYHYYMSMYLNLDYPFNTFLFIPLDRFMDFYNNYWELTATGHGIFPSGHCFTNYIIFIPYLITESFPYLVYAGIFTIYLFLYNYFNIKINFNDKNGNLSLIRNSFIFSFLTYPFLFAIDRGNQEMYIFIMLSLSILLYYDKKYIISVLLLGIAIHTKIYYAVFLLIYFADKKYREIGIAILLYFILPLPVYYIDKWLIPWFQSDSSFFSNFIFLKSAGSPLNSYNRLYVIGDMGAAYCSSLYGAVKAVLYLLFPNITSGSYPIYRLFRIYSLISLLFAGLMAIYICFFEKEIWKKVALTTFSLILFPFITGDYRLLMLYIPLWLFINSKQSSRYDVFYSILFGLLLIPKDYYIIRDNISISVIINPIIILLFMIFVIYEGLRTWLAQHSKKEKQSLS